MKFVLETLLQKAVHLDKNGFDVIFTSASDELNFKNETGISKIMDRMNDSNITPGNKNHIDMKATLGLIFQTYHESSMRRYAQEKNLTIIILTDGVWTGTRNKEDACEKVVEFNNRLHEIIPSLIDRPLGIDFIQFGDDEDANTILRALDDYLIHYGIP